MDLMHWFYLDIINPHMNAVSIGNSWLYFAKQKNDHYLLVGVRDTIERKIYILKNVTYLFNRANLLWQTYKIINLDAGELSETAFKVTLQNYSNHLDERLSG